MARALPFYVQHLFGLLRALGWKQKHCVTALGVSVQTINHWATGRLNVPVRYRASLIMLVDLAIRSAEHEASSPPAPTYAEWRARCEHFLSLWALECAEKQGRTDAWYANLGRDLALTFDKPLSEHSLETCHTALALHLEAVRVLRLKLLLHKTTREHGTYSSFNNLDRSFHLTYTLWVQADAAAGERLERSPQSAEALRERVLTIPTLSVEQREWISTWVPEEEARYSQEMRARSRNRGQRGETDNQQPEEPSGETPAQT